MRWLQVLLSLLERVRGTCSVKNITSKPSVECDLQVDYFTKLKALDGELSRTSSALRDLRSVLSEEGTSGFYTSPAKGTRRVGPVVGPE